MPIYEYKCDSCKNDFEELVMGNGNVKCPKCGAVKVSRKMSVCGFISSSGFVSSSGSSCGGCSKSSCSGCSCH